MLKPFFDWFGSLAFSAGLRESTWLFPVVDALHLVSLAVFAGAVLIGCGDSDDDGGADNEMDGS